MRSRCFRARPHTFNARSAVRTMWSSWSRVNGSRGTTQGYRARRWRERRGPPSLLRGKRPVGAPPKRMSIRACVEFQYDVAGRMGKPPYLSPGLRASPVERLTAGGCDAYASPRPTKRTYWLIVARSDATGEVKYFVSNAPPKTALLTLLKVAFTRAGIEHVFRLAKTEIGFGHFEGRSYKGLMRHMTLCQLVLLFAAEQTDRLRGEKSGPDDRADGPRVKHAVPRLAPASLPAVAG